MLVAESFVSKKQDSKHLELLSIASQSASVIVQVPVSYLSIVIVSFACRIYLFTL